MPFPSPASLDGLALGELREAVGTLIAEVSRLRAENLALRDEVARLKGLPPRPPIRPSGMDRATSTAVTPSTPSQLKRKRGGKRDRDAVTSECVLAAAVPAGSRFKGYEDILVRDPRLSAEVIRYRRERWLTPCGKTVVAALPAGIAGGFGPEPRRFVLEGAVIVSDDAGQFRVGDHALCWVHAERLVHKLMPGTAAQQKATETVRALIWRLYADLKAYKGNPAPRRAAGLRVRFDRIFGRKTGYVTLDRLLARLHRRKHELLCVLRRPDIPLHTNGSENDIRACVTKRTISGGTVSELGRTARDVMLGLMKTCAKLGVSFFRYIGHRLGIPGEHNIEPLPNLVRLATRA